MYINSFYVYVGMILLKTLYIYSVHNINYKNEVNKNENTN